MKRLFIFDMDGTLLYKTTAALEIARVTNTHDKLMELENKFHNGLIDSKEFAYNIYKLWGHIDKAVMNKAFNDADKIKNIKKVVNLIKNTGSKTCIITMSPDNFAHFFFDYGFDYIFASEFPKSASDTLDLALILSPEDKIKIAQELCESLGLKFDESVAFGDSMSDYQLFECLKNTVAINSTLNLSKISKISYEGLDILVPYRKIMNLLENEV